MPNVFGLPNGYSTNTELGRIEISSYDDVATIVFTDLNQQKTTTELRIYHLSELETTGVFLRTPELANCEDIVNTWFTRKTNSLLIKYASHAQTALVFSADNNVESYFNRLPNSYFILVDYFREQYFSDFLNSNQHCRAILQPLSSCESSEKGKSPRPTQHQGLIALRTIAGMDQKRIDLLASRVGCLERMLRHGVTFQQMVKLHFNLLEKYLSDIFKIERLLDYVTINQIIGSDHTPPPIENSKLQSSGIDEIRSRTISRGFRNDTHTFYYTITDSTLTVTASHLQSGLKTKYTANIGAFEKNTKDSTDSIKESVNHLNPESLIHDWYALETHPTSDMDKNLTQQLLYCPDLNYWMHITASKAFPMEVFKSHSYLFAKIPYFNELSLLEQFANQGQSIQSIRALPEMTQKKLDILARYSESIALCFEKGLSVSDIPCIEDDRLAFILKNFYSAKDALEYVSIFDLFGVKNPSSTLKNTMGFFSNSATALPNTATTQSSGYDNCVLF